MADSGRHREQIAAQRGKLATGRVVHDLQGIGHSEMREVTAARARRSPPSPTTHPRSLSHVAHGPGGLQPPPQPHRDPGACRRGLIVAVAGLKPYTSPLPCRGAWQTMWMRAAMPFGSVSAAVTPEEGRGHAVGDTRVGASARRTRWRPSRRARTRAGSYAASLTVACSRSMTRCREVDRGRPWQSGREQWCWGLG
jgi:hypothetical protein